MVPPSGLGEGSYKRFHQGPGPSATQLALRPVVLPSSSYTLLSFSSPLTGSLGDVTSVGPGPYAMKTCVSRPFPAQVTRLLDVLPHSVAPPGDQGGGLSVGPHWGPVASATQLTPDRLTLPSPSSVYNKTIFYYFLYLTFLFIFILNLFWTN